MSEKVIVTKSKITNLADKVRAKAGTSINYSIDAMADAVENLQIGVDENSIYSELNEMKFGVGYTLTLICDDSVINSDYFYSLDSGVTWLQFTASTMVLNGITKIKFKTTTTTSNYIAVGTTYGNHDIQFSGPNGSNSDREITEDTTWYVFTKVDEGGSSD